MPPDIRTFFAAKKPKKKGKGGASVAPDNNNKATEEDANKKSKKQRTSNNNNDNDNTKNDEKKTSSPVVVNSSTSSNAKKRKSKEGSGDNDSQDRVEISASAFFAKSKEPENSSSNNDKQDNNKDDSNKDDKPVPPSPSKRARKAVGSSEIEPTNQSSKKQPILLLEDDSDDDDDIALPASARVASTRKNKSSRKKIVVDDDDDDDDKDNDEDFVVNIDDDDKDDDNDVAYEEEEPPPKPAKKRRSTPVKKAPPAAAAATSSASKPKRATPASSGGGGAKRKRSPSAAKKAPPRRPPLKPTRQVDYFDVDKGTSSCLEGYTFVLTGLLPDGGSRQDATDWIKCLGGRVTTTVSSKTDYLVVLGPELEDGRPYTEGSKYKKATNELQNSCMVVNGKAALYGLMQQYSDLVAEERGEGSASASAAAEPAKPAAPAAAKPVMANPYAKKITTNPYLTKKTTNPYAKSAAKPDAAAASAPPNRLKSDNPSSSSNASMLWVDRYKPDTAGEILGNQESVRKLKAWLARWEERFNKDSLVGKAFSNPQGPWKAALLSGPPGIGKTTTATLVARESGREVVEYNASDVRSKKALQDSLGDITGSRSIQFATASSSGQHQQQKRAKRCIIMDEVDGMGAGDRSGVSELIQMIKNSRVPIICICNDRQSQKLKSLIPHCMDLKYRRPTKSAIAKRAVEVGAQEGFTVELNAAEAIAESCGNDVRQVLNALQMWASSSDENEHRSMTYRDLKERERSIKKDEILRVSLFDAARLLLEGRRGLGGADERKAMSHFMHRNDAFFVDYSFTGLLVQQNYLKVVQGQFNEAKRSGSDEKIQATLDRMYLAAESMSDYAEAEHKLRSDQNWSVLPFVGALAVKTGFHAGGNTGGIVPGFPEFTTWLGRNSNKGKRQRLLSEMSHHMNYKISGGTTEMRLSYLPTLRSRFASLLSSRDDQTEKAIQLMDDYGLDRDDVLEKMDEFRMDPKDKAFAQLLDSKKKAAFTRTYNAGAHKSQALVAEQGKAATKKKRGSGTGGLSSKDPDAIDEDPDDEEDDEDGGGNDGDDDDDMDPAKLAELFKSKGRKKAGAASKKKAAPKKAVGTKKKAPAARGGRKRG